LFGEGGEAAVSVRSVCRAAELNSRYFYENFADINELLSAVYDEIVTELGTVLAAATRDMSDDSGARWRAGIRAVLDFTAADPRRGKVLFAGAGGNSVFTARRAAAKRQLRRMIITDRRRSGQDDDPLAGEVEAAIYVGALSEMAREWSSGSLGTDLDRVVDSAMGLLSPGGILS
jgi:AcrR family transcriptional regulator